MSGEDVTATERDEHAFCSSFHCCDDHPSGKPWGPNVAEWDRHYSERGKGHLAEMVGRDRNGAAPRPTEMSVSPTWVRCETCGIDVPADLARGGDRHPLTCDGCARAATVAGLLDREGVRTAAEAGKGKGPTLDGPGPRPSPNEAMYRTWPCGSPPASGQRQRYPGRFEYHLRTNYPEFKAETVLHMFAGSCEWGTSTDLRAETGADIVSPFDQIPHEYDGTFSAVLADPPYADHYQGEWGGELPKPKHILREACRLVKPGGLIGILHIIIIPAYKEYGVERIGIHPILAGPNNAVRVFNVFRTAAEDCGCGKGANCQADDYLRGAS